MKIHYNPHAGKRIIPIANFIQRSFPEVEMIKVSGIEKLQRLIEKELSSKEKSITVMGGDGTVNAAAKVLAGKEVVLGIIPAGHGNDFARGLGIPTDPIEALMIAAGRRNVKKVDLVKVGDDFYVNSFGIGFDAMVAGMSKEKRNYVKNVFKGLLSFKEFRAKIGYITEKKQETINEDILMIVIANGKTEGGGFVISKRKDPFQGGVVDMLLVKPMSKIKRILAAPLFFTNYFDFPKEISLIEGVKRAEISASSQFFHMDGEVIPKKEKVEISVCSEYLSVAVR